MEQKIREALEQIRPVLQRDGGEMCIRDRSTTKSI